MTNNIDAENQVIGAVLMSDDALRDIMSVAAPDDFFNLQNRVIFRAITSLYNAGTSVDLATVSAELGKSGEVDRIGGLEYLIDLCDTVVSPSNALAYYKIVHDATIRRRIIETARKAENAALYDIAKSEDLLASFMDSAISISRDNHTDIQEPDELAASFAVSLGKALEPIQTPFTWINTIAGGLLPGNLFTVAGRTGAGKSAFALQLAKGISDTHRTLYISLEMLPEEQISRYIAGETGIPARDILLHRVADAEQPALNDALSHYGKTHLYFTSSCHNIQEIEKLIRQRTPEAVIIDTVNLVKSSGENERVKMLNITRELKQTALTHGIPIIILAQLSRRTDEKLSPTLADIKESASIEEDSDVVLLLSDVDSSVKLDGLEKSGRTAIPSRQIFREIRQSGGRLIMALIQKNRNGKTGQAYLRFDGGRFRFDEIAPEQLEIVEDCPF